MYHWDTMLARRSLMATVIFGAISALASSVAIAQPADPDRHIPLPDGEVSKAGAFTAWLIDPTTRYDHGVIETLSRPAALSSNDRARDLSTDCPRTPYSRIAASGLPTSTATACRRPSL
jgi:hypothetical protein